MVEYTNRVICGNSGTELYGQETRDGVCCICNKTPDDNVNIYQMRYVKNPLINEEYIFGTFCEKCAMEIFHLE